MFSPAKAIVTGALVFAVGGALLIAQPFEHRGIVPGAETEAVVTTWVTGTIIGAPSGCTSGDAELDGGITRIRDGKCSPQTWFASDPRLSGSADWLWSEDAYETDEGSVSVYATAVYLRNEGGGWACSSYELAEDFSDSAPTGTTFTCAGDGGYEGLSSLVVGLPEPAFTIVGLIFSGDLPPLPEPLPAD